jgi:hypothetical protein
MNKKGFILISILGLTTSLLVFVSVALSFSLTSLRALNDYQGYVQSLYK